MANAEQSPGQIAELAALRQCLAALALSPAVRQRLDQAFAESAEQFQQRLQQMTRQAQRWAFLGDIAGKVMHEIRNPLNAIFLHADVIQGELQCPTLDSQPQMLDSLTDIRTEVRRLYDIMQDYLALARLAVIQYEPEDMANFLRACGRLIQEQARSRGIVLHLPGTGTPRFCRTPSGDLTTRLPEPAATGAGCYVAGRYPDPARPAHCLA